MGSVIWIEHSDNCCKERELSFGSWFYLRKLSQEEYDRREKENQLLAADEKMVVATEEVKTYKWVQL
jgi:hypothetical protein